MTLEELKLIHKFILDAWVFDNSTGFMEYEKAKGIVEREIRIREMDPRRDSEK